MLRVCFRLTPSQETTQLPSPSVPSVHVRVRVLSVGQAFRVHSVHGEIVRSVHALGSGQGLLRVSVSDTPAQDTVQVPVPGVPSVQVRERVLAVGQAFRVHALQGEMIRSVQAGGGVRNATQAGVSRLPGGYAACAWLPAPAWTPTPDSHGLAAGSEHATPPRRVRSAYWHMAGSWSA